MLRTACSCRGRGCMTASNFSSSQVMIPPAKATNRITIIANAMAREIVVGKNGKAESVSYIDKATLRGNRVYAKAFVVAASACESARLLLAVSFLYTRFWTVIRRFL